MITQSKIARLALVFCLILAALPQTCAEEPAADANAAERQARLKEMRSAVGAIEVNEKVGNQVHSA